MPQKTRELQQKQPLSTIQITTAVSCYIWRKVEVASFPSPVSSSGANLGGDWELETGYWQLSFNPMLRQVITERALTDSHDFRGVLLHAA